MSSRSETLALAVAARFGERVRALPALAGEVACEVPAAELRNVCRELRAAPELSFEQLIDLAGVDFLDYGRDEWNTLSSTSSGFSRGVNRIRELVSEPRPGRFAVTYQLLSVTHNWRLRLRSFTQQGEPPLIDSVVDIWASANWFEREAFDLFGILFQGEQNDAFNCALNVKDPAAPWSPNSVVAVEMFYDQPQLVGVPIISNHFTDPVPLYAHTVMRITGDRGNKGGEGGGCKLLPIAVHISTFEDLEEGDRVDNIRNGTGSGNFGWLRWTDDTEAIPSASNSEQYLSEELANPRLSMNDFREAYKPPLCTDSDDTVINAGDCVWGLTGNINSNGVARTQLESIIQGGQLHRVPVWDEAPGTGSNADYRIVRFALVRLNAYDLTGNPKTISATFMGWHDKSCKGNKH